MRLRGKTKLNPSLQTVSCCKQILSELDAHGKLCCLLTPGVGGKDRKLSSYSKPDNHLDCVNKAAMTVSKSKLQYPLGFLLTLGVVSRLAACFGVKMCRHNSSYF